ITQTTNDVVSSRGANVLRTRVFVWQANGDATSTLLSTLERSVDGLTTWETIPGGTTTSVKSLPTAGSYTVMQTAPDPSYIISLFTTGRVVSITRYDGTEAQIGKTSYGYD